MVEQVGGGEATGTSRATSAGVVTRGEKSWTFLYVFAGFAVSIGSTMVSMLDCLPWWVREILLIEFAYVTFWAVLFDGRTQDRLLGWKRRYEAQAR